jgi:hypothetical protein
MDRAMTVDPRIVTDEMVEVGAAVIHGGNGCTCRAGAKGDARDVLEAVFAADAVEGDRPCLVGRACRAEICRDGCKWPDPDAVSGGGVEPSREWSDEDRYSLASRAVTDAKALVVKLTAALREIAEDAYTFSECVGIAELALAAAGEGEDPRCATCRDVGAAYCDDCSSRVRPDARSGSRLPKPLAAAGEGEDPPRKFRHEGQWESAKHDAAELAAARACEKCGGSGKVHAEMAAFPTSWESCSACGGSGSRLPEPEDH